MRRASIALVAGVTAALLLADVAAARIRPQRGMAGVRVGMTQPQVLGVLGAPSRTRTGSNEFGPFTELRYPGRIRVFFQGNRDVTSISTTGRSERTSRGVGVGSRERTVRRKVRGVRCETIAGVRSCHIGRFEPGRRVTDFAIRRGKVTRVTIGIVID